MNELKLLCGTKIKAEDGGKLPTFEMIAYSGAPMKPEGWWTPVIVDLAGVKIASQHRPILRQHDHNKIVGHSQSVRVTDKGIEVSGVLSNTDSEHTREIINTSKNGFQWQASIGANPIRTEQLEQGAETVVNGRTITGPMTISRETEIGEISFVPLGADGDTSAKVTASKKGGKVMFEKAALRLAKHNGIAAAMKFSDEDIEKMDEKEAKAALKKCMKAEDDDKGKVEAEEEDDKEKVEAEDEDSKSKGDGKKAEAAARARIAAARKAEADDLRRVDAIKAAVKKHNVSEIEIVNGGEARTVNLAAHAIENGWTVEKTELEAMRSARPGAGVGVFYVTSKPEMNDAVLEAAILQAAGRQFQLEDDDFYQDKDGGRTSRRVDARTQRQTQAALKARYTDQVQQAAHTLFKGRIGLQQVLAASAAQHGYRGSEVIRDDGDVERVLRAQNWRQHGIEADGASTASLSNVLANVMNKFMLQGYLYVEQAWKDISGTRPVKDFKPTKSINLFGDFIFDQVGPSGELKNANLQDQAFANQADQYGKILTIDRKSIINDDLGMLTTVPMMMGRGSGLKLNKTFWTTWLDTTQKDDGGSTAFWATTHTIPNQQGNANYISGAATALSSASLQTAQQTMDKQIDPMGYPLGVDASILLYPVELESTAWELMNSQFIIMQSLGSTSSAAKQPSENRWKGRFTPVKSRYLSNSAFTGYSTTAWWLLANPGLIPVIECCFLGGQETPQVTQAGPDYQFNILGISIRGVFDFGVTMQNFRGGVKSAGA